MKWPLFHVLLVLELAGLPALTQQTAPASRPDAYTLLSVWGESGSADGQLSEPIGIALAPREIFISDAGNHRIQVFDLLSGRFLRAFGERGDALGQLARPMHLTFHDGKLYVAEYLNDRIQVFSPEGRSLAIFGSPGSGPRQLDAPAGVAIDATGTLYIADFYNQRVQIWNPQGETLRQLGATGQVGSEPGRFQYPTGVAVLTSGNLAVADAYNDRIQVFSSEGSLVSAWDGSADSSVGGHQDRFRTAMSVAEGPRGSLFVADFYNHKIRELTVEGIPLAAFGSHGAAPGEFDRPTDVAIDHQGRVYVVDFGNNRVQVFHRSGDTPPPPSTDPKGGEDLHQ